MGDLWQERNERKIARLRQVAELYREFTLAGSSTPAKDIARRMRVSNVGTVRTWLHRARVEGLLESPAHSPRAVSWGANAWRACSTCRVEWPCKSAPGGDE